MRVRGSVMPRGAFSIESLPNKEGYVRVRFYENARPYTEETDMGTSSGWEYDEYTLEILHTDTLSEEIDNQYERYLEQAKLKELYAQPYDPARDKQLREHVDASVSATSIAFVTLAESGGIDDVTAGEHAELFGAWAPDVKYEAGNLRQYNGRLWRCVQAHTSQADWTPDVAVSLWAKAADPAEEWPVWSQPVGAHDVYTEGDKVSHNGKHWTSSVDGNVWEPGVYGWTESETEKGG